MKFSEFKELVKTNYNEIFPYSACTIDLGALGKDTVFVTYYLAGNQSEFPNKISQNDLFHISFHIMQKMKRYGDGIKLEDDTELPETLVLDVHQKTIMTKPDNDYMAYGSVSLPFRRTSGTPEKIIDTLKRYAEIVKKTLTELYEEDALPVGQQSNIKELVASKLGISETKKTEDIGYDYWGSKKMEPFEYMKGESKLQEDNEEKYLEDVDAEVDEDNESDDLSNLIQEFKDKNGMYEFVVDDLIDDCEDYEGDTLSEKLWKRCEDVLTHGCVSGMVGSLIYYTDTTAFFDKYVDEIYDLIEDYGPDEFLEMISANVSATEILVNADTAKNWITWRAYEEVVYQFQNRLEEIDPNIEY